MNNNKYKTLLGTVFKHCIQYINEVCSLAKMHLVSSMKRNYYFSNNHMKNNIKRRNTGYILDICKCV